MSTTESRIGSGTRVMPESTSIITNDIGSSIEDLIAAIDATIKPFSDGDLVTGIVVKIDKDEVLLDIGFKSEGVILAKELSIRSDVEPKDLVTLGEQIECLVLQKEDKEGRLMLSRKRASYERTWGRVEEIRKAGTEVKGTVIEVVKGGLIVDIGLRGFLPASLVDLRRVRDLQQFIGQELECKIIELDRNRNNVVLSRRAFLEETHKDQRKDFMENLKVGEKRKGTISSIVNFGAFVDLGGVDGLIHVSEISWRHVDNPGEVVEIGQEVEVEVLSVELERDRVSLSLKNTQDDPWQKFANSHALGDVVTGVVTKVVPFGAFVQVAEGTEGLVHISELSDAHVELPEQIIQVGQEVQARVIDVDAERRRISLSLKQAIDPGAMAYSSFTPGGPKAKPSDEEALTAEEPAAADASGAETAPAAPSEPEPTPEPEPEPEMQREPDPEPASAPADGDESLESIVEEMKRDRT